MTFGDAIQARVFDADPETLARSLWAANSAVPVENFAPPWDALAAALFARVQAAAGEGSCASRGEFAKLGFEIKGLTTSAKIMPGVALRYYQ